MFNSVKNLSVIISLFLLISASATASVNVAPQTLLIELSDGQQLYVTPKGNSQQQWVELDDGSLAMNYQGHWYLAEYQNELLTNTGQPLASGVETLSYVPMQMQVQSASIQSGQSLSSVSNYRYSSFAKSVQNFEQPLLVLRVSFSDVDFKYDLASFEQTFFAQQESVREYFSENSYGKFSVQPVKESQGNHNDGVVDVRLPQAHPNFGGSYGQNSQKLVASALAVANNYIDFNQYDKNSDGKLDANELAVVVLVAGYENAYGGSAAPEPRVWAHKSDFYAGQAYDGVKVAAYAMFGERHDSHQATLGIICHELGHLLFDLPDLYDRTGQSMGIGRWGLMGLGSWNSYSGHSGNKPAHMLAWSKAKAGFVDVQDYDHANGEINLPATTEQASALRVWVDPYRHGEHFLLEYRKQQQFDRGLPGEGLLISHVDDWVGEAIGSQQNDFASHKWVDIEEADGRNDLDQSQNRGDSSDVFNQQQNYFGSSSLPAALDYDGNVTGVEVHSITTNDTAVAQVVSPYESLGDNLSHDEMGPTTLWGGRNVSTVVEYDLDSAMPWLHGVDVFMNSTGQVTLTLAENFDGEQISNEKIQETFSVKLGWNRLFFSVPQATNGADKVYLHADISANSGSALVIDNKGIASGKTYVENGSGFNVMAFDVTQRLLVATQSQGFAYRIPNYTPPKAQQKSSKKSSGGGAMFWLLFPLLVFIRRSWL